MLLCTLMSSASFATSGIVYPDSARVRFSWQLTGDTVIVQLLNEGVTKVRHTSITDFTEGAVSHVSCKVDGSEIGSISVMNIWASVYPDRFTSSWEVGDFNQSVELRFLAPDYRPGNLSWVGYTGFPLFGMADSVYTPGDCCSGLRGNIDGDAYDATDIADLVYFVEFMFEASSSPAPPCLEEADLTGDGLLDVADLIILVDYTFGKNSDLPACP